MYLLISSIFIRNNSYTNYKITGLNDKITKMVTTSDSWSHNHFIKNSDWYHLINSQMTWHWFPKHLSLCQTIIRYTKIPLYGCLKTCSEILSQINQDNIRKSKGIQWFKIFSIPLIASRIIWKYSLMQILSQ